MGNLLAVNVAVTQETTSPAEVGQSPVPPMSQGAQDPTLTDFGPPRADGTPALGNYHLISRLGEGGMGVVWRARQEGTKQEVAIKWLGASADGEWGRVRFKREVELAARLNHRHIARVYDSGLPSENFYYVMELVDGVPLAAYLRAGSSLSASRPGLRWMIDVCRAVGYAHSKGIIHRDLKPSNIMVAAGGEPRILDFGLAEALIATQPEGAVELGTSGRSGHVSDPKAGTWEYMAPEQRAGRAEEVDKPSDVYSLGKIILELLRGQVLREVNLTDPAVLKTTVNQIVRGNLRMAIPGVRRLGNLRRRELSSILLKALAISPNDRHGSANDLAEELERFLDNRPLRCLPATPRYRARKWYSRHRLPATVAVIVFLATCAYTTYFVVNLAKAHRDVAAAFEYLRDFLRRADLGTSDGQEVTVRQLIGDLDRDMQMRFGENPRGEALIRETAGEVLFNRGEFKVARSNLERALSLRLNQLHDDDRLKSAAVREFLAETCRELGDLDTADALVDMALKTRSSKLGPKALETLQCINTQACILRDRGKFDDAETLLRNALRNTDTSLDPERPVEAALTLTRTLAMVLRDSPNLTRERIDQAVELARKSLLVRERQFSSPHHPQVLEAKKDYSSVLSARGRFDGNYQEAREYCLSVIQEGGRFSKRQHPDLATWKNDLAFIYYRENNLSEAEKWFADAYRDCVDYRGAAHAYTLTVRENLLLTQAEILIGEATRHGKFDPQKASEVERGLQESISALKSRRAVEAHVVDISHSLGCLLDIERKLDQEKTLYLQMIQYLNDQHAQPAVIEAAQRDLAEFHRYHEPDGAPDN